MSQFDLEQSEPIRGTFIPEKVPFVPQRYAFQNKQHVDFKSDYKLIGDLIKKLDYPYRKNFLTKLSNKSVESEINRFLLALDAYIESFDGADPIMNPEDIIDIAFRGPEGATFLKKIRTKAIKESFGCRYFDDPELEEYPTYIIKDIGEIFNYQYLPHWTDPDERDIEYMNIDVNQKEDALILFREILRDLLNSKDFQNLKKVEPWEILNEITGSSSLDDKTFKTRKNYRLKMNKKQTFSESLGFAKRSLIQVHPDGARDAVILTPDSLNTVKLIERQTFEILQYFDESFMTRSYTSQNKKLRKMLFNSEFSHLDMKKEGLTKPRSLLKIMLEELYKATNLDIYRLSSFYDDIRIIDNDNILYPKRGHGLGMANSLTTLMQIVIFYMTKYRLSQEGVYIEGDCLTLNDDYLAGFGTKREAEYYSEEHFSVLEDLGIMKNTKKSFLATDFFVFCEIYYYKRKEHKKKSYLLREIYNAFACRNIAHAKSVTASLAWRPGWFDECLKELVSYWGYEFFEGEENLPPKLGGWFSHKMNNLDLSIKHLDWSEYDVKYVKALNACRPYHIIRKVRKGKILTPPVGFMKGFGILNWDSKSLHLLNFRSKKELDSTFLRISKNTEVYNKYWDWVFKKRQKLFRKKYDFLSPQNFVRKIIEYYPDIDYYPIDFMIEREVEGFIERRRTENLFDSDTPLMNHLANFNEILEGAYFPESYSLHFNDLDYNPKLFHDAREQLKKVIFEKTDWRMPVIPEIVYPKNLLDERDFLDSYLNPYQLTLVWYLENGWRGIPILKTEYRSPMIEEKKKVFGRIPSFSEMFYIGNIENISSVEKKKILRAYCTKYEEPQEEQFIYLFSEHIKCKIKDPLVEEYQSKSLLINDNLPLFEENDIDIERLKSKSYDEIYNLIDRLEEQIIQDVLNSLSETGGSTLYENPHVFNERESPTQIEDDLDYYDSLINDELEDSESEEGNESETKSVDSYSYIGEELSDSSDS